MDIQLLQNYLMKGYPFPLKLPLYFGQNSLDYISVGLSGSSILSYYITRVFFCHYHTP